MTASRADTPRQDHLVSDALIQKAEWMPALYNTSVSAKIWAVSQRSSSSEQPPLQYPEYTLPGGTEYVCSGHDFWTSGFFPGCLSLLYERKKRWPRFSSEVLDEHDLQGAIKIWTANLHSQAFRRDTHDLGFMIQPWAQIAWELDADDQCFKSMYVAAHSLASRFDPKIGCIRSWDTCNTKIYDFPSTETAFLVIIDNMMNLDLLYTVAHATGERHLADIATTHAETTLSSHIRDDFSTFHVVNFDQATGKVMDKFTNQGMADASCWSRGQAWAITGFIQSYVWTKKSEFLEVAVNMAEMFVDRLPSDGVPPWDFADPAAYEPGMQCPKDASAGLVVAYGLLLLHQMLGSASTGKDSKFLDHALRIVRGTVETCLTPAAHFFPTSGAEKKAHAGIGLETILDHSTINNFEYAPRRWADHGLVYADYFFLRIGNKLLELGIEPF